MSLRQLAVLALVALFVCVVVVFVLPSAAFGQDVPFVILSSLSIGTTTFDLQTTSTALKRCSTCKEANPLMHFKSKPLTYTVSLGLTSGVIYGSARLKRDGSKWWWVPLVVSSVVHGVAGVSNQRR